MKKLDWPLWLENWFKQHPFKEPPAPLRRNYAEEVMVRIRTQEEKRSRWAIDWLPRPVPSMAWSGALAAVLAIVVLASGPDQEEKDLIEEMEALETVSATEEFLSDEELLEELDRIDSGRTIGGD